MKKLPIGIQTFRKIIEEGFLYVDKTKQIYELLNSGNYFFISRPRRFGKSLTLSTIREIYSGSRELFEGLWIETQWNWNKIHPVVHIQFNAIGYATNGLENALHNELGRIATHYDIALTAESYDQKFRELLEKLAGSRGKVVVLIDEYDKPLIDYLEKEQLPTAFEHQRILKNFYSILKSADPHIEFLLITGVSKFSKVSIFSDLNNLDDLTLDKSTLDLMGYTQQELEFYFEHWINEMQEDQLASTRETLLDLIREWYNGYSWDGKIKVYNPFSILNFFKKSKFDDYWFKSGTPSFLIKKMQEQHLFNLNKLLASATLMESYTLDNLDVRSLLFQTGYLTIKHIDYTRGLYTFDYPNREVEQAMYNHLIGALLHRSTTESIIPVAQMEDAFISNDPAKVVTVMNAMLKDVPSLLLAGQDEHFYHALVHLHFRYLGFFIQSEVHTSDGRMDAVVHTPDRIFLLEFKINQSSGAALKQIRDKDYAGKFGTDGKEIVAIGINFDTRKRTISDWKSEELQA